MGTFVNAGLGEERLLRSLQALTLALGLFACGTNDNQTKGFGFMPLGGTGTGAGAGVGMPAAGTAAGTGGSAAPVAGTGNAGVGMPAAGTGAGTGGAAAPVAGTGSAGVGTGGEPEPFMPTGEPITAPDMTWTWVDFPDTVCRDGTPSGLNVSFNSASDKVMIYLQGGGACFDSATCGLNPAAVSEIDRGAQTAGVFDRSRPENVVASWSFVYVPYCTGDVHIGTVDDGSVPDLAGVQHFMGRPNLEKFLHRLVPTFSDVSQVLLTGASAGGFGAAANMEFVQWAFGDIPVTAIDDCGPAMSSEYLPTCLQSQWSTLWGFEQSILKDCGADCPDPNEFSIPYSLHVMHKFPDHLGGLIESAADSVITSFYGYGTNDCTGSLLTPVPAATFEAGLLDYRAKIMEAGGKLGTYYVPGTQHTFIGSDSFYTTTVGGVPLYQWFADIVDGTAAAHVGP